MQLNTLQLAWVNTLLSWGNKIGLQMNFSSSEVYQK